MNRLQALKIAKIAYKDINAVIQKYNHGVIDYLPIRFHWAGNITIGEHEFKEQELMEYDEYE